MSITLYPGYIKCIHRTYTGSGKYANATRSYREDKKVKSLHPPSKVVDNDRKIYDYKRIGLVRFDFEKESESEYGRCTTSIGGGKVCLAWR